MDSTTDVSTSPIINEDTSEQKNSSQMQQHLQEFPGHGNEEESAAATEEITSTMTSLSPTNPGDRLSDAVCEPECGFGKNGEIGKNEQNHDEQSLSLNTAAIAETSGDRSEPPRRFDLSSIWIALKNLELMRHYLRRQLLLWRSRPSSVEQDMELSRLQRVLIRFQGHVDFFSTQNRSTLEELASDRYSRSHRRHPARSAWIASTRWFSASEFTDYTSLWRSRRIRRKRLCRRMDRKWQVRSMVNNSSSSSYHAITAGIMAAPSKRQFAALGVGGVGGCCCCCGANAADSFCHSCHHRQRRRQQRHHHNHRIQSSLLVSTTAQASSVLVSPTDHQHLSPQPTTNPRGNAANTPWTNGQQQQQTPNSTSTTPTMIMSHLHQQQQYSNPQIDYSIDLNPNNNKNQSPPDMFNNRQQTQLEQPQYIQNHGNIIHHLSTNTPIQQPPPQQQPVIISVPDAAYMEYDTQKIAITVREMLTANNIGQRIFARHVLGLSQGTVSELLSKPKPWNKLTEKGRESYKKMWNWANFPTGISQLKAFSPRKDQTTTVTSINCGSLANSASAIVAQNSLVQLVSSDSGVMNGILSKSVLENRHRSSIPGDATESPETMERIDQILIDAGRQIAQSKHELDLYKAAAAVRKTGLNCTNGLIETSTMAQQHQLSNSSPARSSSCTIIGGAGSISGGGGGGGGGGSAGTTNCINNNNNHHHHHQHHHHHRRTTTTNCIGVINSSTNAPPPGLLQLQNSNRTMIRMEDSALQPQFIDTEHLVKGVKQYLSSHCISQRAFGEVVLGLSQGSVSDLLARPKPWNALTQKGREPFLRMKAFLDSPETYERLFARPSANQSNGGVYTGNTLKSEDPSNVKRNNNNKINNLHGSRTNTASTVSVDNITAVPAAAAAYAGGISRDNLAAAATTICGAGGNAQAAENSSNATASVEIDTEEISKKVKEILARYQIGQRLFGESVLNLSQGTVSELLSKPKPWKSLSAKGREPYHRMQVWLTTPGSIQKLVKSKLERSGNQPTAMQQSVLRNVKIDPKRRCVDLPPSQPPPATNPGGTISALWNQQANNNDPNQNLSLSFPIDTSGSSNFGSRSYSVGPGTHCLADLFGENLTAILPSLQNLANAYSTVAVNNGSSSSSSNPNTSLQFGPSLFPDFMFNSAQNELFPSPSDLASSLPRALVPPDVADAGTAAANEQTSGADGCAAHPVSSETPSESPLEPSTTNTTTTTTQNQDLTGRRKRTEPKKIFRASRLYDWQEQENQQLTQTPPTNNDNEDPDSTGQTPQQTSPDSTHKSAAESMESSKRPTSSSAAATAAATTTKHHHHQPHHDSTTTTTLESGEDGGGENGEHAHDS